MKLCIPEQVLTQHIAVVGKTGSGKTCTAKYIIEHVSRNDARVAVLDPIKSDWWGLTSSSDGRHAGLPFHILGGPRGHVGLHAQAGAAIGEIVGNGSLPLSILDMADFEMGGLQQFFIHFAPMLIRRMRGVLYLVVEEAHEFAPKERAGFGMENMAIHFAKKLATAGRSKGIRLIIATQRTQALHNAVLGSCDTLIAHRMTAPADQEPVVKWLKANLPSDKAKEVAASLQSLKTGEAWVCSGELKFFERIQFPRISTYDNSAAPTDDQSAIDVKTAAVDHDKLRTIIGTAVEEAKANDPAELKRKIIALEKQLAAKPNVAPTATPTIKEVRVVTDADLSALKSMELAVNETTVQARVWSNNIAAFTDTLAQLKAEINRAASLKQFFTPHVRTGVLKSNPVPFRHREHVAVGAHNGAVGTCEIGAGGKRRILVALAQYPEGMGSTRLSLLTGISQNGGTWRTYLGELRSAGYVDGGGEHMRIAPAGLEALGQYTPLPTGESLRDYWRGRLGDSGKRRIFDSIVEAYPRAISCEEVSRATGIDTAGGTWRTYLGELRGLELITGRGELRASDYLFE